jgi:hypothetical protein
LNVTRRTGETLPLFGLILALYLLSSLLFTREYFSRTIEWRQAPLEKMIAFEADTPFQYRVLAPLVIRLLVHITDVDPYSISKVLTVVWTFASLLAFRLLLREFHSEVVSSFGAFFLVYALFWNHAVFGIWRMPFDLPGVLFFTIGLAALLRAKWSVFYVVFLLGAVNRETILFLTCAHMLLAFKGTGRTLPWKHVSIQVGLWTVVRIVLTVVFRGNEGGQFQTQVGANIEHLSSGIATVPLLLSFGGLWVPALAGWKVMDERTRRLLLLAVPFVGMMFLVGNIHELRIYNELVPIVCMSALGVLLALFERVRKGSTSR